MSARCERCADPIGDDRKLCGACWTDMVRGRSRLSSDVVHREQCELRHRPDLSSDAP